MAEATQADRETGPAPATGSFAIIARSAPLEERTRVLKHDDTFALFDRSLDIRPGGQGEQGLYHDGTRHLSRLELTVDGRSPMLLRSTARTDRTVLTADLANIESRAAGRIAVPAGSIHLVRSRFLWKGVSYESIRLRHYGLEPARVRLALSFEADFADVFEVRGTSRLHRGTALTPEVADGRVILVYRGLDDVLRSSTIECSPAPTRSEPDQFLFDQVLEPREERFILVTVRCEREDRQAAGSMPYQLALGRAEASLDEGRAGSAAVRASDESADQWLARSSLDLEMLLGSTPVGPYPAAGIPWFATPFGRDGILAALECLWLRPELARQVLRFLAATQAVEFDPERHAEPGRILHEARAGEMAALGEVPFGLYYGSVDPTPLFVLLAGRYYQRTGDRELIEAIWPNLLVALAWIDGPGDRDGDGFIEYGGAPGEAVVHQGWKDSVDAVFHRDGRLAPGPIAMVEVQAYAYGAKREAAALAEMLGDVGLAGRLRAEARDLRRRFDQRFWLDDLGTYALALDGDKRPCRVRSSNAGRCLFTGIVRPERAPRLVATLMSEPSFSGWGVRTIAAGGARYNPMSYHNGSVWPHDSALIGEGLAGVGSRDAANRIFEGLFHASLTLDLRRLPELFAGFHRRPGEAPIRYPLACAPHATSAAAPFLLLRAALGLTIRGPEAQIVFDQPVLPPFMDAVDILGLTVGAGSVDLHLERFGSEVGIRVLDQRGEVEIVTVR